jgi:hypothetical protein
MTRGEIIQVLLDLFPQPSYLEIGVDNGWTFNAVVARSKHAVDPAFKFATHDVEDHERSVRHFPITSDAYFAGPGIRRGLDVAFIDGLHTFEQTLRDLLNVQNNLNPGGAIVIDDVNPRLYHASLPNPAEAFRVRDHQASYFPQMAADSSWMGDVYKLVFFIQSFMQAWSYACVGETRSQLVVWRQARPPQQVGQRSVAALGRLGFEDLVADQAVLNVLPMNIIVARIQAARQATADSGAQVTTR